MKHPLNLIRSLALVCVIPITSQAQTITNWTAPGSGNWSESTNWLPASVPGPGANLQFGNRLTTGYNALNDLPPTSFQSLTFDAKVGTITGLSPGTLAGVNLLGNPVSLSGPGAAIRQLGGGAAGLNLAGVHLTSAVALEGSGPGNLIVNAPLSGPGLLLVNRAPDSQTLVGGSSSYSGGTILQSGQLGLASSTALGSGPVTFTGGKLRMHIFVAPSGLTLPNALVSTSEPVRFVSNNSGILAGVISGPGGLRNEATGVTTRLTGANSYTGPTIAVATSSTSGNNVITFEGNGSALSTSGLTAQGFCTLTVDNTAANLTDRLPDTAPIRLHRATFNMVGNPSANSSESAGPMVFDGYTTVSMTPGTGLAAALLTPSMTRTDRGVLFVRGLALGINAPFTPNTASLLISAPPLASLIGGGGPANSTTQSIVPWAVGRGANTGNPDTFVTIDAMNGVRALLATEFSSSIVDGSSTTENVRLAGPAVVILPTTLNSLVLAGGSASGTGSLNLSSGALLVASGTPTLAVPLNFSAVEAVVTTQGNTTVSASMTGSAGLTKAGTSNLIFSTAPTMTGVLTINAGAVQAPSDALLGTFDSIHINGGRLQYDHAGTETTSRIITLGAAGGTLTVNTAGAKLELLSALSGSGAFVKQGSGELILTQPSTHAGSVVVNGGILSISTAAQLGLGNTIVMPSGPTLRLTAPATIDRTLLLTGGSGSAVLDIQADVIWSGALKHSGTATNAFSLIKTGAATLLLTSSENTQNGVFTISGGTLQVDGYLPGANTSASGLVVAANAAVTGTGRIERSTALSGSDAANLAHISPGSPAWPAGKIALTFESTLELGVFTRHLSRIGKNGMTVTKAARLLPVPDNSVRFAVVLEPGVIPGPGSEFKLLEIDERPLTGDLDWSDNLDLPPGVVWDTSRFTSEGILAVSGASSAPQITLQPLPQVVAPGGTIQLSAAFTGSDPLVLQWYQGNLPVSGAQSPDLVIANATSADASAYRLEVTSPFGSVISQTVSVQVTQVPAFAAPMPNTMVVEGAPINLTANLGGEYPILVEWMRGSAVIFSETVNSSASTWSKAAATPSDAGTYEIKLTNGFGSTSVFFDLAVISPVQINAQPVRVSGTLGTSVSFSVTASGSAPLTYQWQFRPTPSSSFANIPGAINPSHNVVIGSSTEGEYRVEVSNPADSVFSAAASLTALAAGNGHFIGQWTGIVDRSSALNAGLGGRFDLKASGSGAYTGSLQLGVQRLSLRGAIADPANPTVTFNIPRRGNTPLTLSFVLLGTDHRLRDVSLTDGTNTIGGQGWRNPWTRTNPATTYAGYYTLSLDWADAALYDSPANDAIVPQGTGFGSFTVAATSGRLTLAGRLKEGTPFTVASFCGSQGRIPVFHMFKVAGQNGSWQGSLGIQAAVPNPDNTLTGLLNWSRPSVSNRIYAVGWTELNLTATGARYTPPASAERTLDLTLSAAGIDTAEPLSGPQRLTLVSRNVATFNTPNSRRTTLKFNAKTGLFNGTAQLSQSVVIPPAITSITVPRKLTYHGVMLGAQGAGHFLLPKLPSAAGENPKRNTVILGGDVHLTPSP